MITSKTLFDFRNNCRFLAVLAVLLAVSGCVSLQPFPNAARSGDTITLAVGSADGMTAENTTVDFYSNASPSNPISVPVRSVLKIYPDKTSAAWLNDTPPVSRRSSHGAWLSVIVVDLPSLPDGDGFMRVTSGVDVVYPNLAATPDGLDIPITILPGTGSANPFNFAAIDGDNQDSDLSKLDPMPQAIIRPAVPPEGTATTYSYGAIEMSLTVDINDFAGDPALDQDIAVVLDDQPQNTFNQTQLIWKRDGDNMKIMLISPKGMYGHEARVSITPLGRTVNGLNVYGIVGMPTLDSISYYNLNGELSSDPLPPLPTITKIDNELFP